MKHPPMMRRCSKYVGRPMFGVRTGSGVECSKVKHDGWAAGIYVRSAILNGLPSLRFHCDRGGGKCVSHESGKKLST